ncbi:MAG TPA: D-alanyl-D-alanine carboxypeptidase [Myxococcota bacterium]|nr:D-alanyl-D-alanine carboxypeptidase [Myxococcota bacterium]
MRGRARFARFAATASVLLASLAASPSAGPGARRAGEGARGGAPPPRSDTRSRTPAAPASALARALAEDARTLVGADQGVYVEAADGTVLVAQAASRAVHPASVSKVPTTLALLRALGPDHRFETRFSAAGWIEDGVLQGNLLVEASGDPFFVDENALVVLLALRELGLERVAGNLVAKGPLLFDWKREAAAARLRAALEGRVPESAWRAVRAHDGGGGDDARDGVGRPSGAGRASAAPQPPAKSGAPRVAGPPALRFGRAAASGAGPARVLVTHRSQPLLPLVKALNGYSNNIFAPFADAAGGIGAVERVARASVPAAFRGEIVLGDGAGANPRNRLSPRAAVALIRALDEELARHGASLADVLPVAGVDEGTLRHRLDGPGERAHVVAKTGTYGSYGACALAGAVRGRSGTVYFAILNRGVAIDPARRRQDAFVRALLVALDTEPWPYRRDDAPAFTRAEVRAASAP